LEGTGVIFRNNSDFGLQFVPIADVPSTGHLDHCEPLILTRKLNETYKIIDLKSTQELQ
jgi:hypothetical protein